MTNPDSGEAGKYLAEFTATAEYAAARDALVGDIDTWLGEVAESNMTGDQSGVTIKGDGVTSPLELEAAKIDGREGDILRVRGSDPMASMMHGGEYNPARRHEVIVSFGVEHVRTTGNKERYFTYEVMGDGSLRQGFVDPRGYHTKRTAYDADEVDLAQAAFGGIKNALL